MPSSVSSSDESFEVSNFPMAVATQEPDLPGAPVLSIYNRRKSHRVPAYKSSKQCAQKKKLVDEIDELDRDFRSLACRAAVNVVNVDLLQLKVHITQLPLSMKHLHIKFFSGSLTAINDAKSVVEIFGILGQYWDFLNCSLLHHIIDAFGDKRLKKDAKRYLQRLTVFRNETTVWDFVHKWTGSLPPFFSSLTMEMVEKWKHRSLEELEQFRRGFSCQCAFESFLPPLQNGKAGSLILTWGQHCSYPVNDLVLQCQSMTTLHFLRSHGVLKIHFKGMCIFDYKSNIVSFAV